MLTDVNALARVLITYSAYHSSYEGARKPKTTALCYDGARKPKAKAMLGHNTASLKHTYLFLT